MYSPPIGRTQSEYNESRDFNKKVHKKIKVILTPLTLEAMSLLDVDECPKFLLESVTLTHEEYGQLIECGVLEAINTTLGKIIDDYEDEAIYNSEELTKTLEILDNHLTHENSSTMSKIIALNTLRSKTEQACFSSSRILQTLH